jgi:hypothetical protein
LLGAWVGTSVCDRKQSWLAQIPPPVLDCAVPDCASASNS